MWNAETFDPVVIDTELGWAQAIGMNAVRVFLHEIPWLKDPAGCAKRIGTFLRIADKHKIKVIFVLFDSVWSPFPEPGIQRDVRPGVHNSGWVQDPGAAALVDETHWSRYLQYVEDVIHEFLTDKRVLAWDLWNEPDNMNDGSYRSSEPANKAELVARCCRRFSNTRARRCLPAAHQRVCGAAIGRAPISSRAVEKIQLEESDIISFHNYDKPAISKSASSGCSNITGRFCARNTWRASATAPSRVFCPSRRNTTWRRLAGAWWPARPDLPAVGFVAAPLHRSPACHLASRYFPRQRLALLAGRDRFHTSDHRPRLRKQKKANKHSRAILS